MKAHRDIISGCGVVCFAAALYAATFTVKDFTASSIGADFLPRLAAVILAVLGVLLVSQTLKAPANGQTAAPKTQKALPANGPMLVAINILLFCVYLYLLEDVGFLITTTLYLFAQIWLLTAPARRRPVLFALVSVLTSVISYYLFVMVFQVMLPAGVLG